LFRKEVPQYQMTAWLLTALSAPIIQTAGHTGWVSTALAAVLVIPLCWLVNTYCPRGLPDRAWFCVLEWIAVTAVLAGITAWSEEAWPTGRDFPVVPLTLLMLAVLSSLKGASGASRVSSVLFWFAALLYAIILVCGAGEMKLRWMTPSRDLPSSQVLLILLLPSGLCLLPREKGKGLSVGIMVTGLLFIIVSAWVAGNLPRKVIADTVWPFYEASKGLALPGIAGRFESLVSVAATMGYFSLQSMLLSMAGCVADSLREGWGKAGIIGAAIIAGIYILLFPPVHSSWLVIITLLGWCILPLFGAFAGKRKKTKKTENNA